MITKLLNSKMLVSSLFVAVTLSLGVRANDDEVVDRQCFLETKVIRPELTTTSVPTTKGRYVSQFGLVQLANGNVLFFQSYESSSISLSMYDVKTKKVVQVDSGPSSFSGKQPMIQEVIPGRLYYAPFKPAILIKVSADSTGIKVQKLAFNGGSRNIVATANPGESQYSLFLVDESGRIRKSKYDLNEGFAESKFDGLAEAGVSVSNSNIIKLADDRLVFNGNDSSIIRYDTIDNILERQSVASEYYANTQNTLSGNGDILALYDYDYDAYLYSISGDLKGKKGPKLNGESGIRTVALSGSLFAHLTSKTLHFFNEKMDLLKSYTSPNNVSLQGSDLRKFGPIPDSVVFLRQDGYLMVVSSQLELLLQQKVMNAAGQFTYSPKTGSIAIYSNDPSELMVGKIVTKEIIKKKIVPCNSAGAKRNQGLEAPQIENTINFAGATESTEAGKPKVAPTGPGNSGQKDDGKTPYDN